MIRVYQCECSIVHQESLRVAGDVQEIECDRFSVRRQLALHPRPISRVAIMCQEQAIALHIKHGDRIVLHAARSPLMKDRVTAGCHPNSNLHGHAHDASFPGTCQSFECLKSLLRIGLWAGRFRHRHLLRQRDGGRRNQDD